MKRIVFILLLTTIACSGNLLAQEYKFAAGVRLSNASPTISNSVSAKYFIKQQEALEALVSFGNRFGIGLLYEKHRPFAGESGFRWFYGFGGYAGFQGGDTYLGPSGVLGFDYKFKDVPLNLSLDWKPELDIIPKVNLVPDAFGLTARYAF
jgi:hypothetical protein